MSPIKALVLLCFGSAVFVSVCSAQVAKSQATASSIPDTKQPSGRSYTSGSPVDPNNYMNQVFSHKPVELFHLVPILLVLAFIPLLLPIIFQLFAGVFTPFTPNFSHGRRRRDTNFHKNPEISEVLVDLVKRVGDSFQKFNQFSN